jgi:hypothetical protein
MSKEHHVLVVPGLGGENAGFRKIVDPWKKYGFTPHVHDVRWKDGENEFQPKLERLIAVIDELHSHDGIVSLVGTSAGGSAVLNAFFDRKDKIHRVVNVCGRLRAGQNVYPTLEDASQKSLAFKNSVTLFENREPQLTDEERNKILTIRALFDEIVPTSTTILQGATNIQIFSVEHILSIAVAMTIYVRPIIEFLQKDLQARRG